MIKKSSVLVFLAITWFLVMSHIEVIAQTLETTDDPASTEVNFSEVDWDEEETEETTPVDSKGTLSGINWDEEVEEETVETEENSQTEHVSIKQNSVPQPSDNTMIHWQGVLLFITYILGGGLTAYFSRNKGIALKFPPEVIILLHTFWPLELLLLPFFKKSSSAKGSAPRDHLVR